jgi:cation transport protein ChaC
MNHDEDPIPYSYRHVPGLCGRLTPLEQSLVRMTPDVFALWDERARAMGRPANWRLSDEEREQDRRALLGNRMPDEDLWVFSYGSLMWDPALMFAEVRLADLPGYQRRFSFKTTLGRGCQEYPALMLSLDKQADRCCKGLVFRIAADKVDAESEMLWRREMIRGTYCPRMLQVDTPQGSVSAVVFTSNSAHGDYVGELTLQQTATMIAKAHGVIGSNRHYVEQLAAQLGVLEIEDDYVAQLMQLL